MSLNAVVLRFAVAAIAFSVPALGSGAAHADSYTVTTPNLHGGGEGGPVTLFVPAFNPSLGTLTGYAFDYTDVNFSDSVTYSQYTGGAVTGYFENSVRTVPDFTTTIALPTGLLSRVDGSRTVTENLVFPSISGTLPVTWASGGSGSPSSLLDLSFEFFPNPVITSKNLLSGGDNFGGFSFSGNLAETFTYTPFSRHAVPEPASLAVLGTSLLGLGFARRRSATLVLATIFA